MPTHVIITERKDIFDLRGGKRFITLHLNPIILTGGCWLEKSAESSYKCVTNSRPKMDGTIPFRA